MDLVFSEQLESNFLWKKKSIRTHCKQSALDKYGQIINISMGDGVYRRSIPGQFLAIELVTCISKHATEEIRIEVRTNSVMNLM